MPRDPETQTILDPGRLGERLATLSGIGRLRDAARGLDAYLVGGAVRDLLLEADRADVDVVVEGDVDELARRLGGAVRAHERFGTVAVALDGLEVDLATARAESYAHPGALPDVRPAGLREDLARRDFTVNAMAVPLTGETALIDPHGGLADLQAGLLRVLHPASIADDPTRALRAARYAARYGFTLEPATARQIEAANLATVSADRTDAELRRLAREPAARSGFELLARWGLLALPPGAAELIDAVSEVLATPPWSGVAGRADAVLAAVRGRGAGEARELAAVTPASPSEAVERARGRDGVTLALARAAGAAWLDRYVSDWRDVRLEIDGDDLIEQGIAQGPAIGRGLDAALRAKLDGEVAGREEELAVALAAAGDAP